MSFAFIAFALDAALGAMLFVAIPRSRFKLAVLSFYLLFSGGLFAGAFEAIGNAKPINTEWRAMGRLRIIGLYWDEPAKQVFVTVLRDGTPKLYLYPWPKDSNAVEDAQDQWRRREQGDEFYTSSDDVSAIVKQPGAKLPTKDN